MKLIDWNEFNKESFYISDSCGVSIGVFDGFHKGHKYLIDRLNDNYLKEKVVFTFRKNPGYLLKRKLYNGDIYTLEQKITAFKKAGVTTTVLIDFSGDFSKLSGKYFILCIAEHLNMKKLAAGEDFKCGAGNDTHVCDLVKILSGKKINLEIIERIKYSNIAVSSSVIRQYILEGNFDEAEKLIEYGFAVDLNKVQIHEMSGYCYADRKDITQLLPESGNFCLNITINNITSRKEVIIDNKKISWYKRSGYSDRVKGE